MTQTDFNFNLNQDILEYFGVNYILSCITGVPLIFQIYLYFLAVFRKRHRLTNIRDQMVYHQPNFKLINKLGLSSVVCE